MAGFVWINDHDVEADLGLTLAPNALVDSGLSVSRSTALIPNSLMAFTSPDAVLSPRSFSLGFFVQPATVAARRAALNVLLDVAPLGALHEVRFGDDPTMVILAYVAGDGFANLIPTHPLDFPRGTLTLEMVAPDPSWADRFSRSTTFGTTRTRIPCGTLYSDGVIWITGAATTPTITYYRANGEVLATMTLATLAAGDSYEIDLKWETIRKFTAGVAGTFTAGIAFKTAGNFFKVSPADGDYLLADWPMLSTSAGVGLYIAPRRFRA